MQRRPQRRVDHVPVEAHRIVGRRLHRLQAFEFVQELRIVAGARLFGAFTTNDGTANGMCAGEWMDVVGI